MDIGRASPTRRWLGRAFLVALPLLVVLAAAVAIRPSPAFLFHSYMNASRWQFLDKASDKLMVSAILPRPGSRSFVAQPELDRPPFDRIARPYHITTNDAGYRDGPFLPREQGSQHRVLVLGDSITFGRGVELSERYTDLLEQRLGPDVELLNLGVGGCTTECQAKILEKFIYLKPDLVVWQASANDVDQALWQLAQQRSTTPLSASVLQVVTQSDALLALMYQLVGDRREEQIAKAVAFSAEHYKSAIDGIFATCRANNVPVVVLEVPLADGAWYSQHVRDACRAHAGLCREVVTVRFDAEPDGPPAARDWVSDTADTIGMSEAELAGVLPYRHMFQDIVHPNAAANRVIADKLEPTLRAQWPPHLARTQHQDVAAP